ncbi:MAG: LuxR C-terminal-related transcriptional regulator [Ilumatobacter sp.]|uniref:LuxR C-terminal-related transcriptional regulator n=1 Tax=Ilumatobacter sp. TaxID=1967498 RepID=UPI002604B65A|nr:LuxR C-terminal-related transcriptional regulator [Ilumatobacter sp.]MDJ0770109.1 LuxR C-terminal-related transcriptional regulator [Ilumatobacter sp.]
MMRRRTLVERVVSNPPALTLLVAPSGCGKSELLAQVVESLGDRVAWLSVDPYDDDPVRFWTYLLAALESVAGASFDDVRRRARAPGVPLATSVVEPLLVRLGSTPVTMIVDDYHLVTNGLVHESMQHLVRHVPETMRVVLASRTQPPFALGRSRVRDEVAELRARDLALSGDQAKQLLESTSGRAISESAVAVVQERTEGWAAGVYLAGLSLRQADDVDAFVASFAGDDRNVAEYLATEVVDELDDETQTFLREASVLEELSGPVCDHVLERSATGAWLPELALTNMLLIPTDRRNESFRFHHIFRDWLRLDLDLRAPGRASTLHRRAMEFYSSRDPRLAGHHAVLTGDPELAEHALVEWGTELVDHGELATVFRWSEALPQSRYARDPSLAVMVGWMLIGAGRVDEVEPWLQLAENAHAAGESWRGEMGLGDVLNLRAYQAVLAGDIETAAERAHDAISYARWARTRVSANLHLGATGYWLGDDRSSAWLAESASAAKAHPEPYAYIQAAAYLALIAFDDDRYDDATALVGDAHAAIDEFGLHEFGQTAVAHLAAGRLALAGGRIDAADESFDRACTLAGRIHSRPLTIAALLGRTESVHLSGDRAAARELIAQAVAELERAPSPGLLPEFAAVVERRIRRGAPAPAQRASNRRELVEDLTDRELAVLRLLPGRLTQREIGGALHLSMNTVKTHTRNIFRKLSVSSRDEAVEVARSIGLL